MPKTETEKKAEQKVRNAERKAIERILIRKALAAGIRVHEMELLDELQKEGGHTLKGRAVVLDETEDPQGE